MDLIYPSEAEHRPGARAMLLRHIDGLPAGKAFRLTLVEWRSTRSNRQNRYLHGLAFKLLSEATGYSLDDIKEHLCGEYFGWKQEKCPKTPNNPRGVRDVPVRTTTVNELGERDVLGWDGFWEFVEFVQQFGAYHGITIPDPDPEYRRLAQKARAERRQVEPSAAHSLL